MKLALVVVGVLAFIALAAIGTFGCRQYEINRCRDAGGYAIAPAWWSENPTDIQCVYIPRGEQP